VTPTRSFQGRIIWVTGAGRGIGRATATLLTQRGATVLATARSLADLQSLQDALGSAIEVCPGDVTDPAAMQAIVDAAIAKHGHLDGLVNNAGVMAPVGPLASADPTAWQHCLSVNLMGAVHTLRAALPYLRRTQGAVVNLSSGAAVQAVPHLSAYGVSKAALDHLTRIVAAEEAAHGVRINALYPGVVNTTMQTRARDLSREQAGPALHDALHAYSTQSLLQPPERPAAAILWLLGRWSVPRTGLLLDLDAPGTWSAVRRDVLGQ
jgi:NAD(P)-dependent dehydrogenase (short-subunit alcohol dehydrogenase family)